MSVYIRCVINIGAKDEIWIADIEDTIAVMLTVRSFHPFKLLIATFLLFTYSYNICDIKYQSL